MVQDWNGFNNYADGIPARKKSSDQMITVYGLKNCDTCRKARKWLDENSIDHRFHDVRADGLDPADLAAWAAALGWEKLLNRRGTTWRGLPETEKEGLDDCSSQALMVTHPALIKRPVFHIAGNYAIGFDELTKAMLKGAPT